MPQLRMRWKGFRRVRRQVCKRLARRLSELGLEDTDDYRRLLDRRPEEWAVLDAFCRITISRFYRDRAVVDHLRASVLPELAREATQRDGHLRCWSAGCASGEEPYTLSLAWHLDVSEGFPKVSFEVLATDADPTMIERARRACYPPASLRDVPPEWIDIAFRPSASQRCLRPRYRREVELLLEDVRLGAAQGPFDLILCRNLAFTYFDLPLQRHVLSMILPELAPGGGLVLGSHEEIPDGPWPLRRDHPTLPIFREARVAATT